MRKHALHPRHERASAAEALARERAGSDFDPDLVGGLLRLSTRTGFWSILAQESVCSTVLAMGPPSSFRQISDPDVDTVCKALADLADVKVRRTWHHSPLVAQASVEMARRLGLSETELTHIRRAALVHDVGKAGVPRSILINQGPLSPGESERLRLHPYYADRVLNQVPQLQPLAPAVSAHHEWFNGSGFYRQLAGAAIPLGGRLLAVADSFAVQLRALGEAADPEAALAALRPLVGSHFGPDCFAALEGDGVVAPRAAPQGSTDPRVKALTRREAEVLRLASQGLSNKAIAEQLVISIKTTEHHLEHIYDKLGVSYRTAAVVCRAARLRLSPEGTTSGVIRGSR